MENQRLAVNLPHSIAPPPSHLRPLILSSWKRRPEPLQGLLQLHDCFPLSWGGLAVPRGGYLNMQTNSHSSHRRWWPTRIGGGPLG
eukprot:351082-Chlamydomonas_euryale.AAC.6